MFLKLISQRKAWSLQKCWVPYKHWGNVYIICAKKNSTDKTRGVQSSDSEKPLGNYLHLLILLYTQKHALQLCGRCIIQCNTGSTSTSTRFLSSTVEQQINDTHFAVALGANTQQKCPKKIFCWVSNFEHFEAIIHLVILFFYLTPYHAVDKWSWFTKLTTSETTCIICHCVCLDWTMLYQIFVPYEPAARSSNNLS